ncbi:MAG: NUDIX hydrolase [Mycobacteriales bacterium]
MHAHRFCPLCGGPLTGGRPQLGTGCGAPHVRDPKGGVGVVVRDEQGRLLLVQRDIDPERGQWALPAGFLDADESPQEAAARECREETGLEVAVGDLLGLYPAGGGTAFFLSFTATVTGGTLAAGDDAQDARFFGPDELPPLAFASTLAAATSDGGA